MHKQLIASWIFNWEMFRKQGKRIKWNEMWVGKIGHGKSHIKPDIYSALQG